MILDEKLMIVPFSVCMANRTAAPQPGAEMAAQTLALITSLITLHESPDPSKARFLHL